MIVVAHSEEDHFDLWHREMRQHLGSVLDHLLDGLAFASTLGRHYGPREPSLRVRRSIWGGGKQPRGQTLPPPRVFYNDKGWVMPCNLCGSRETVDGRLCPTCFLK